MRTDLFLKRISYQGDPESLLKEICSDFDLGSLQSFEVITIGYEDLNIILVSDSGRYLVKILNSSRSPESIERYAKIIGAVAHAGISHPKALLTKRGQLLFTMRHRKHDMSAMAFEYVEGSSFFQFGTNPTLDEVTFFSREAGKINQIDFEPPFEYDHWAIVNFRKEYEEKHSYLSADDRGLMTPVFSEFYGFQNIDALPLAFTHGDILTTNTLRASDGRLFIIDFSVSNYGPRIVELAVLLCDLFFDPSDQAHTMEMYRTSLRSYGEIIDLTDSEKSALPLFLRVAHAQHVLQASYQKGALQNLSAENGYWLKKGRAGLEQGLPLPW